MNPQQKQVRKTCVCTQKLSVPGVRVAQAYLHAHICLPLADVIRQPRLQHLRILLRTVIVEARQSQERDAILHRFLPVASRLVT